MRATPENLYAAIEAVKELGYNFKLADAVCEMWKDRASKVLGLPQTTLFESVNPERHFPDFEGYKKAIVATFEASTGLSHGKLAKINEWYYLAGTIFYLRESTEKQLVLSFRQEYQRKQFLQKFPSAVSYQNGKTKIKGSELAEAKKYVLLSYLVSRYFDGKRIPEALEADAQALLDTL